MNNISDRDRTILEMRKQGISYSKIAREFNISSTRVKHIEVKYYQEKALSDKWPLYSFLTNRTRNALRNYFGDKVFSNPVILHKYGRRRIARLKNIGKYSLREMDKALECLGFINKGEAW